MLPQSARCLVWAPRFVSCPAQSCGYCAVFSGEEHLCLRAPLQSVSTQENQGWGQPEGSGCPCYCVPAQWGPESAHQLRIDPLIQTLSQREESAKLWIVYLPAREADKVAVAVQILPTISFRVPHGEDRRVRLVFWPSIVVSITELLVLQDFISVLLQKVSKHHRGIGHPAAEQIMNHLEQHTPSFQQPAFKRGTSNITCQFQMSFIASSADCTNHNNTTYPM